jgi:hypothetical protein
MILRYHFQTITKFEPREAKDLGGLNDPLDVGKLDSVGSG